ncbi:MAG: carboxylating nicotinate-nucleotide diphosphorylase [Bacteroidetes bacterium]|jgi:nicotinate-nucleotide pyrophosphorylase (carboxylating)|nr:carboxylating nicotinate-nucleotide diphosphorylase [Bacteroidota bacterium]
MGNNDRLLEQHQGEIKGLIERALMEDVGSGDVTTLATVSPGARANAHLLAKEKGIWVGTCIAHLLYGQYFTDVSCTVHANDGDPMEPGQVICELQGSTAQILTSERLMLNLVQHLSGIATWTHTMVRALEGTPTKLLDTRKTTPGLRVLEKYAVSMGGGQNHRMGLYDMVMVKDNHVDQCGSITLAVHRVCDYLDQHGLDLKIEVETRNMVEVAEALSLNRVHWIMLDNFSPQGVRQAVTEIAGKKVTEASGGIGMHNIREFALAGVDFISSGALTQKSKALDLSLKIRR